MTYKKQMEKVIKEYMASIGFKYYAPQYIYVKKIDDEKDIPYNHVHLP